MKIISLRNWGDLEDYFKWTVIPIIFKNQLEALTTGGAFQLVGFPKVNWTGTGLFHGGAHISVSLNLLLRGHSISPERNLPISCLPVPWDQRGCLLGRVSLSQYIPCLFCCTWGPWFCRMNFPTPGWIRKGPSSGC